MIEDKFYENCSVKFNYPGHMKRAKQTIEASLKKVDLLLEVCDARIPYTSKENCLQIERNNKQSIILFNKSDLANPKWNQKWLDYYKKRKQNCLFISLKKKENLQKLKIAIKKIQQEVFLKYKNKVIQPPAIRMMVVGLPNTGKSTLINYLIGNKKTHTGSKPGITIYSQWVKLPYKIEVLDTPGILPPLIQTEEAIHKFYATYVIKEDAQIESIAFQYLFETCKDFRDVIFNKYQLKETDFYIVLEKIKEKYGVLKNNFYQKIFTDFRKGVMGRVTLDCQIPDD